VTLDAGERVCLRAAIARLRAGSRNVPVAGRLERTDEGWSIRDASGRVDAVAALSTAGDGDIVSALLSLDPGDEPRIEVVSVLATRMVAPPHQDKDLTERFDVLEKRARVVRALRGWFAERGFLEVETPARVACPGLEPHLVAFPAGGDRWLATSPELHLKRLLAAGAERVVEFARAFRDDEGGPNHLSEFMLLEWYRAYEGLDRIVDDLSELLPLAARAAGADPVSCGDCDLTLSPERITVRDAVRREAGIDLALCRETARLRSVLERLGIATDSSDRWDDLFHRLFIERVQPSLGRGRPTVLSEFPASQAALARVRPDDQWPVAIRFELFVAGVELANAFDELIDPDEQRARHESDRAVRLDAGREAPPLDEPFLRALAAGHPPAAGIALGVDRLVALLLGEDGARRVVAFPGEL
jgi:lysyl-tRNA synthetase class 2